MKTGKMLVNPKITEDYYTLTELRRAMTELGDYWVFDHITKAIAQAEKNRVYDEAMKAHDSRPDLRDAQVQ